MGNGVYVRDPHIKVYSAEAFPLDVDRSAMSLLLGIEGRRFRVYATHLDYQSETRRLRQVAKLFEIMERDDGLPTLLCGDFNALLRSDYSDEEWNAMNQRRISRQWEACASKVIPRIVADGWLKDLSGCKPIFGSRFQTRIDYFFGTQNVKVVETDTQIPNANHLSDHQNIMVKIAI